MHMEDLSEEEQLQRALEMSMSNDNEEMNQEMMSAVLGSLPGVDANDARIQKALEGIAEKKNKDKKDEGNDK